MSLSVAIAQPPVISLQSIAIFTSCGPRRVRISAESFHLYRANSPVPVVALFLVSIELAHDRIVVGENWIERKRHSWLVGVGERREIPPIAPDKQPLWKVLQCALKPDLSRIRVLPSS